MPKQKITILNGPNLNMLGQRPTAVYGATRLEEISENCQAKAQEKGFLLEFLQTNHEGVLVDWVQQACQESAGLIINPAAFSHTSIALFDALEIFPGPIVEVHLSNIYRREDFRAHSYVSRRANAVISGCGSLGYVLALEYLSTIL